MRLWASFEKGIHWKVWRPIILLSRPKGSPDPVRGAQLARRRGPLEWSARGGFGLGFLALIMRRKMMK